SWAPEPDEDPVDEPELELVEEPAREPVRKIESRRANGLGLSSSGPRTVRPGLVPATEEDDGAQPVKRRRGRPKGRAVRRQVHFHVDPQEEELLLAAVARYGSQQKGLIARSCRCRRPTSCATRSRACATSASASGSCSKRRTRSSGAEAMGPPAGIAAALAVAFAGAVAL